MVAVQTSSTTAVVIEVRDNAGLDANLCATGVLVYEVRSAIASGTGAAIVLGSRQTTSGAAFNKCGPWADAIYGVGGGDVSSYTHASGATVSVLGAESGGAYRIRVKR